MKTKKQTKPNLKFPKSKVGSRTEKIDSLLERITIALESDAHANRVVFDLLKYLIETPYMCEYIRNLAPTTEEANQTIYEIGKILKG